MHVALAKPSSPDNVEELLHALGDIPPSRVLLHPPPGTATEEDLLRVQDRLCELVDGTLVEKGMGFEEGLVEVAIIQVLNTFVITHRLGVCGSASTTLRMLGGNIRLPDVNFFAWEDLPDRKLPKAKVPRIAPTLAIEVLSESNTAAEMKRKRAEYFESGTKLVWQFDPIARTVDVFTPPAPDSPTRLTAADTLDGGTVLPGFSVPLSEIFSVLDAGPASGS
jgi:Uma2 family endonuclease